MLLFYPYTGLNLTPDSNNRCDLSPGVYGTATITATGMYPDEPITYEPNQGEKVSNTLTKTANHLASKVLKCVPKTVATATTPGEALCVETILDFNGDPIKGATRAVLRRTRRAASSTRTPSRARSAASSSIRAIRASSATTTIEDYVTLKTGSNRSGQRARDATRVAAST